MDLKQQKHLFDLPEDITYLNIASQSPAFNTIHQAGLDGLLQKKRPYLITGSDYFEPVKQLKSLFAQLIDEDDYNRIALIPSASYGIATVTNNIVLKPTDEILIIDEQFPSNYYSWKRLADQYQATIKVVKTPIDSENSGKQWNLDIIEAINSNTAVVAMGHIHWSNGTLFDLKAIRKKSKQHQALLIIDGSQSIGALPFSVKELQPDALICAGYKWLFGPYGCGYAYFSKTFDNGIPLEENWTNRLNSDNFSGLTNYQEQYKPLANRYSAGESASFLNVKMQIAALQQVLEWTPLAIQQYCKTITQKAVHDLRLLGFIIEDEAYRTHHLFGIKLPENIAPEIVKQTLADHNIFVSFRGNYIRLSCHVFNTPEDFETVLSCFSYIIKIT
ncbi:aminotransferase class V-fold PLP-dependent enzyme [Psychroserpens sp. NJDZ02]|uniref:aminotransferase class V-fold PLP-dependent enzyme n=1 Tax=Psychroserpens sp. NJDZ02 TaxID=2570561 RepID=UPI0010A8AA8F|nr:aminotransferase class V-fold PLP-dependent enzyme [Psychroserpens sp. NJDZ02]QCE42611.1 aminotransferase class V-fold PLP-dependent enzyme [Psychroserpens sp. NJDZ02]